MESYKTGFGDLTRQLFWLPTEKVLCVEDQSQINKWFSRMKQGERDKLDIKRYDFFIIMLLSISVSDT